MPLILSPGLVLTPPLDFASHYPIIGYENLVTISNIVAEHEDADYPVTNLANPATNTRWESDDDGAQTLTITVAAEIDYVAFEGHNLTGATVLVETLAPDVGAAYEEQIEVVPGCDEALILRFAAHDVIGVKITITPVASTPPIAAVLFVGKLMPMQKGLQFGHTPIIDGHDVELLTGVSQGGEYLGSIVTFEGRSSGASFRNIDTDWFRSDLRPFLAVANAGQPFFWAWNPRDHDDEIGYCWFASPARPVVNHTSGKLDLSISLLGIAP